MNHYFRALLLLLILSTTSCGTSNKNSKEVQNKSDFKNVDANSFNNEDAKPPVPPSKTIDLKNKGTGPITHLVLPQEIDKELAAKGEKIHQQKCMVCHRPYQKLIGPAPVDILKRRTPEWVMNLIINPEEMVQKDPLAKALMEEYHGVVMPNQKVSEDDARAILEYYRTL